MSKLTSIRDSGLAVIVLLFGSIALANAAGYRVQEIVKAEVGNTSYSIYGGNQSLNNEGQVIGTSRKYYKDKVYHYGDRAFIWSKGQLQHLGTFGAGANKYASSFPNSINDHGKVAGSSTYFVQGIDHGPRAFLWSKGKLHNLGAGDNDFVSSAVVAMNGNGQILGSGLYYDHGMDKGTRVLLWSGGNMQNLGTLGVKAGGYGYSVATAINTRNHVVGGSDYYDHQGNGFGSHAFFWAGGALVDLGTLGVDAGGSGYSVATAINARNHVVGGSDYYDNQGNGFGQRAFLWTGDKLRDLGTLGVDAGGYGSSYAIAINNNNQVLGSSDFYDGQGNWQGTHGFLWAAGTMRDLGALGVDEYDYSFSLPYAMNAMGQVVGFSTYSKKGVAKGYHAFLYQNNAMTDLNSLLPPESGLLLENALAINDKGQITAFGTRTIGESTYKVYVLLTPR